MGRKSFGRAISDDAILHEPSHQPMLIPVAINAGINALWAKVIITIGTGVTVIVLIWDRTATVVAVNAEHSGMRGVRGLRNDRATRDVGA